MVYLVCKGQKEIIEDGGGRNRVILVAIAHSQSQKSTKIDAHSGCGTGDIEVRRLGKSTHERDKRKGAHRSLPTSIISFNPSEDIGMG